MLRHIFAIAVSSVSIGSHALSQTTNFDIIERQISSVPYDSLSALSLGDGVEITRLDSPAGNCIDLTNSPIKKDIPGGTIEINAAINVITSVEDLETKLNRSLGVEASASGNYLKVASGSASTKFTEEYESFIQESASSLMVSVRISADHGRDWLDYRLKPQFQKLLDEGSYEDFRQLCGTHFIRAIKREAYLEYNITVNGLSSLEKETLAESASVSLEGKGGIGQVFSASGKLSTQEKFLRFVKIASQFGSIDIQARLVGAPGIDSLSPSLNTGSTSGQESVQAFFSNLSLIASSFKDTDGAPSQMILLRYSALPEFDASYTRFYVLGEITRKMLLVRSAIKQNETIQNGLPEMWNDYFKSDLLALRKAETQLLAEYTRCYELEECSSNLPNDFLALTINDVLFDGSLRANCGMDALVSIGSQQYRAMSDIAVYWRGWIRFPNHISLSDVSAYYLNTELERVTTSPFDYDYDYSIDPNHLASSGLDGNGEKRTGPGRAIFQIVNESLPTNEVVINGAPNEPLLKEKIALYGDAIYGLTFRFSNGWVVNQLVGKPDMRQCRTLERA
ncbi:hypothetical protein [uncultured Sulfitobacter sp.]|uniref:hypothetical protein n=1 Tax=uncultured Sulfitobacter sp. TaxID=191468 RepID=UPI0026032D8C|nr:hypothetical protein [uncultured Sulfitobacter sp.]